MQWNLGQTVPARAGDPTADTLFAISNEESPDDSTFETALATLRYHRTRWPSHYTILPCLLFTYRVMHSAIRLDDTLGLKSAILSANAAYAWYDGTTLQESPSSFSWENFVRAIEEFPVDDFFQREDMDIEGRQEGRDRRDVLQWFTMRLQQALKKEYSELAMEDECIKDRITALGSCLQGTPPKDLVKHVVQTSRLLHRLHYPGRSDLSRDTGRLALKDLRWFWANTDDLPDLYGPPTLIAANDIRKLEQLSHNAAALKGCLTRCVSGIYVLATCNSTTLTSDSRRDSFRTIFKGSSKAMANDPWSFYIWSTLNVLNETSYTNRITMCRRYHSQTLKTRGMLFRIVAREAKRLAEADDETTEVAPSSNDGYWFPLVTSDLCVRFWDASVCGLMDLESVWKVLEMAANNLDKESAKVIIGWFVAALCWEIERAHACARIAP
jgi:hypothetical protein